MQSFLRSDLSVYLLFWLFLLSPFIAQPFFPQYDLNAFIFLMFPLGVIGLLGLFLLLLIRLFNKDWIHAVAFLFAPLPPVILLYLAHLTAFPQWLYLQNRKIEFLTEIEKEKRIFTKPLTKYFHLGEWGMSFTSSGDTLIVYDETDKTEEQIKVNDTCGKTLKLEKNFYYVKRDFTCW